MGWTRMQVGIALLMVTTGSINTLSAKWADMMKAKNSVGEVVQFNHPFFQANTMFIGEMTCMAAFYVLRAIRRYQYSQRSELSPSVEAVPTFPKIIFLIPALCDMTATCMMYLGLTLTFASSFQMLRGAVIVFTGLMSVFFLGQKLRYFNWGGILLVIAGLVIVGLSDFMTHSTKDSGSMASIITGDAMIVAAQVITATQMVVEQKFLTKYDAPPLLVVGWEGLFGFLSLTICLVIFYFIPAGKFGQGNPRHVLEDSLDAFTMLGNNPLILVPILGTIVSIAFFNFAGVSVTKELSATTRMVLDSVRTFIIWIFSLAIGWQPFQYLQPIGFVVLVCGMLIYNDVIILPFLRRQGILNDGITAQPLVEEAPIPPQEAPSANSSPNKNDHVEGGEQDRF